MKKLISVLLTLAMMLALCSLAGCGDKEKSSGKEKEEKKEPKEKTASVCYPENALLAKETHFDNEGKELGSYEYTYDANGNVVRAYAYDENGNEEWDYCMDFTYDDKGNLIDERYYDESGNVSGGTTYEYSYDADGKVTSKRTLDPDGTVADEAFYTYDDDGKLKSVRGEDRETLYDANGNEIADRVKDYNADGTESWRTQTERSYDANGNVLTWKWPREDGKVTTLEEYTYDEHGNCVSNRHYAGDDLELNWEYKSEYTYDKNGNATSCRTYADGDTEYGEEGLLAEAWDATYDENGNVLTITMYDESGNKARKAEYAYLDQSGSKKLSVEDVMMFRSNLLYMSNY